MGWVAGQAMSLLNAKPIALAVAALGLAPNDDILELGCGSGTALQIMSASLQQGIAHGIDRSAVMLAQARRRNRAAMRSGRIRLYQADFAELPFSENSFDKILAVNVAYFWDEPGQVLCEARRVLRPGGTVALYVTDPVSMRCWKFAGPDTHRHFHADVLSDALGQAGFADGQCSAARISGRPEVWGLIVRATC
jgi:ubiquinone/menaquinone biosynthesis C-methylase UbiE